jgi:hypothetical protein
MCRNVIDGSPRDFSKLSVVAARRSSCARVLRDDEPQCRLSGALARAAPAPFDGAASRIGRAPRQNFPRDRFRDDHLTREIGEQMQVAHLRKCDERGCVHHPELI